jgi:hypothetical protein
MPPPTNPANEMSPQAKLVSLTPLREGESLDNREYPPITGENLDSPSEEGLDHKGNDRLHAGHHQLVNRSKMRHTVMAGSNRRQNLLSI